MFRKRFPEADIVESQHELAAIAEKAGRAIERLGFYAEIQLDLRGMPHETDVWTMLRKIPADETTSCGALTVRFGTRDIRDVTRAIAHDGGMSFRRIASGPAGCP